MAKCGVDAERLSGIGTRLGDVVVDPAIWHDIMDEIGAAAGATGVVLLQSDVRTPDIPRTAGVDEFVRRSYFAEGWHLRDIRAERSVPRLLRGEPVVIDQDIVTPEEMRRTGLYAESLIPNGLQWFAAIGFWADRALWGLTIQRAGREGPFNSNDKRVLGLLAPRLTETATLSKAVGRAVLSGMTNALQLVGRPALALDRSGFVLDINAPAEQVFDDDVRVSDRRLWVRDQRARSLLDAFVDQLRTTPDTTALDVPPIVIQRRTKPPLVIRVLPVGGAARTPFLGARALLLLSDLCRKSGTQPEVLGRTFGLSPAEAKLASLMANGTSPGRAAAELGIARETARNQLKAVFAKTNTHRQAELVALLSRL